MIKDYEKIYETMIEELRTKNSPDISYVVKAFNFAKEKHKDQFRKSGEPYILHPVEVAYILERQDFNSDVICSALLHDTVEDCNVTIEELAKMFNPQVAKIVDSVSAITKETFSEDPDNIYSDTKDFLKYALEDKTYQKLISIGKENKYGFYIKFADRLNNLQTIGVFPWYKKEAKVLETEKWITPLTELLKSKFFYDNLTNECFKLKNSKFKSDFFDYYNRYLTDTEFTINRLKNQISDDINVYLHSHKINSTLYKVIITPKTELEVYNSIVAFYDITSISKIKQSNFNFISTYNIYLIFNEQKEIKEYMQFLYSLIDNSNLATYFSFTNQNVDHFGNYFLSLKDKIRINYDCICLSRYQYTQMQNGTIEGTDVDYVDDSSSGGIVSNFITVYTKSGEGIKIPQGSTVLDFAFKLHNDIGFSCKYAFINSSPNKSPIYTKLNNSDQVEIVCETENGLNLNISQLRWLAYCKNESTQKILIKYFERKYN